MKPIISLLLVVTGFLLVGDAKVAGPEPREKVLPFSPYPLWSATVDYPTSTPVQGPGGVLVVAPYYGSSASRSAPFALTALDASSGSKKWSVATNFTRNHNNPKGFAAAAETKTGGVAAVTFKGDKEVHGYDIRTGAELWAVSISPQNAGVCDSVTGSYDPDVHVDDQLGRFYVALRRSLVCLNATDGSVLWTYAYPYGGDASDVGPFQLYSNRVLVGVLQGRAVGIDALNGGSLWSTTGQSYSHWSVAFYGLASLCKSTGLVGVQGLATNSALTSNNATFAGLNANNGQTLVQTIEPGDSVGMSPPGVSASGAVVLNPYLQVGGYDDTYVTAFNATAPGNSDSAKFLWRAPYYWYVSTVVCDPVYCYVTAVPHESDFSAKLIAHDVKTGSVAWTAPSPFGSQRAQLVVEGTSSGTILYGSSGEYSSGSGSVTAYVVRQN